MPEKTMGIFKLGLFYSSEMYLLLSVNFFYLFVLIHFFWLSGCSFLFCFQRFLYCVFLRIVLSDSVYHPSHAFNVKQKWWIKKTLRTFNILTVNISSKIFLLYNQIILNIIVITVYAEICVFTFKATFEHISEHDAHSIMLYWLF